MRNRMMLSTIAPTMGWLVTGCFEPAPGQPTATDLVSARALIENGGIPHPESISIDRFLAEHFIANDMGDSAQDVAMKVSTAWHRDFDSITPNATIQVTYGAAIETGEFQRGPLNLGLVIDRSRMMNDPVDLRTGTTRFDLVRIALDRLLAQLTTDDFVSIVAFNDASEVLVEAVRGTNIAAIKGATDVLVPQGGVNLTEGLRRGFQTVAKHSRPQRLDRVLLFTDAGLHGMRTPQLGGFFGVMRQYAVTNIGTTMFGIGSSIRDDLRRSIAEIRGGTSAAFGNFDQLAKTIDEEFDFLVAPVAYDMTITLNIPFEFDVVEVHGLSATPPFGRNLVLRAPTLFLTPGQDNGLVLLRLRAGSLASFSQPTTVGTATLNYTTAFGVSQTSGVTPASLPAGQNPAADPSYFQNDEVRRGVLVLNTALTIRRACEDLYRTGALTFDSASRNAAISRIGEFLDYFDELSAGLPDQLTPDSRSLSQERALMVKLRSNLRGSGN